MRISRRLFLATAGAPAAYLAAGLPALGWAAQAIPFAAVKMVAGSPYKTGYAHGSALKVQIARTAEFYRGWLREYTERTTDELLREAGRYLRPLEQHCPQMLEEIRGIADGAGQPLEVILMINARTDLLVTAQAHSSVARTRVYGLCTAGTQCRGSLHRAGPELGLAATNAAEHMPAATEDSATQICGYADRGRHGGEDRHERPPWRMPEFSRTPG